MGRRKNYLYKIGLSIIGVVIIVVVCLIAYTYRWNIINPNKSGSFKIDNVERNFIYHIPKKLKGNPKLIIAYHGSTMSANLMQIFTGHEFDELADFSENTIVVYPQGYEKNWNDCRKQAPYPAKQLQINDVAFTEQIISFFKSGYQIDSANIFAVGYSNGGQMVMKLAKQKPEWFKGFAVICANLPAETNDDCIDTQKPVSLLLMNGVNDPINPYEGGEVILDGQSFGSVISTQQTLQHWLTISNCDSSDNSISQFPQDKMANVVTATQKTYHSKSNKKQVSFIKINDGGHTIPNVNFRIPIKKIGNMNRDTDGPKLIWDFFMRLK